MQTRLPPFHRESLARVNCDSARLSDMWHIRRGNIGASRIGGNVTIFHSAHTVFVGIDRRARLALRDAGHKAGKRRSPVTQSGSVARPASFVLLRRAIAQPQHCSNTAGCMFWQSSDAGRFGAVETPSHQCFFEKPRGFWRKNSVLCNFFPQCCVFEVPHEIGNPVARSRQMLAHSNVEVG